MLQMQKEEFKMNLTTKTAQTIEELKKVAYVAELKKLDNKHIDTIKRAIVLLKNYMKATKLYLEAFKQGD